VSSWARCPRSPESSVRCPAHAGADAALPLIRLGETVLPLGRVISQHHADALTRLMALGGFVALVCLWVVYFGRAEQLVVSHATANEDPIQSVHLRINVIFGVVAGLVTLAAGIEIVLAHARNPDQASAECACSSGPMVYLLSHAFYFRVETGTGWHPRVIGAALLGVATAAACWLPAYAVVTLQVVIFLGWPSASPETQRIHQPPRYLTPSAVASTGCHAPNNERSIHIARRCAG
jgi:low temperature requirement protein LtrA